MNKIKQYGRLQRNRRRLLKLSTGSFMKDYRKYGYTLLEIYDRILSRELKLIIDKGKIHGKI